MERSAGAEKKHPLWPWGVAVGGGVALLVLALTLSLAQRDSNSLRLRLESGDQERASLLQSLAQAKLERVEASLRALAASQPLRYFAETRRATDRSEAARLLLEFTRNERLYAGAYLVDPDGWLLAVERSDEGEPRLVPAETARGRSGSELEPPGWWVEPTAEDFPRILRSSQLSPDGLRLILALDGAELLSEAHLDSPDLGEVIALDERGVVLKGEWSLAESSPSAWRSIRAAERAQVVSQEGLFTSARVTAPGQAEGGEGQGLSWWLVIHRSRTTLEALTHSALSGEVAAFFALLCGAGAGCAALLIGYRFRVLARERAHAGDRRRTLERVATTLELTGTGTWSWNIPEELLDFDTGWARLVGQTPADLGPSFEAWRAAVHPDDLPAAEASLRAHLADESETFQSEHRLRQLDGSWRWVLETARVLERDSLGAPLRVLGVALDIESSRRAQRTAEESSQLAEAVLEVAEDGVVVVDEQGTVVRFNPAAERIFQKPAEEVVGGSLRALLPKTAAREALLERYLADQDPSSWNRRELKGLRSDGERVLLEVSIGEIKPSSCRRRLFVGVLRDVGDRRRHEAELRQARDRAQLYLDLAGAIVVVLDSEGKVLVANDYCARTLGWPQEELVGQSWFERCLPAEARERAQQSLQRVQSDGQRAVVHEGRVETRSGQELVVLWRTVALRDEEGRGAQHVWAGIDLTDQRAQDEALREATRQADAANRAKSTFLANMSHELRTPLNAILGFSELLDQEHFGALGERQRTYVDGILSSGKHLLSLVNDVLDLSKIEAGRLSLDLEWASLDGLVDEALTAIRPQSSKRGIEIRVEVPPSLSEVRIDRLRMRQVLTNLLSNAVKFSPTGGAAVQLRVSQTEGVTRIACSDDGVGVAPEDLPRLFREFDQLGPAQQRPQGTGLGLAISRRLVRLHGGEIEVESELGRGSTFTIVLPRPDAGAPVNERAFRERLRATLAKREVAWAVAWADLRAPGNAELIAEVGRHCREDDLVGLVSSSTIVLAARGAVGFTAADLADRMRAGLARAGCDPSAVEATLCEAEAPLPAGLVSHLGGMA